MSDTPEGEGWWQASDGKYYPPEPGPAPGSRPRPAGQQPTTQRSQHPVAALALVVAAVASVVVVIAAFLTWATIELLGESVSISGTDDGSDGVLTLILGAGALIVAGVARVKGRTGRAMPVIVAVLGALTLLIGLIDIADVTSVADNPVFAGADVSVGIGLWLTALGGLVTTAGGLVAAVKR